MSLLNMRKGKLITFFLVLGLLGKAGYANPFGDVTPSDSAGVQNELPVPQTFMGAGESEIEPLQISSTAASTQGESGFTVAQGHEAAQNKASTVETPPPPKLGITLTGAWESKFIWRGFEILNSGVYRHDVDVSLWDTGFHFRFQGSHPSHDRSKPLLSAHPPWLENAKIFSYDRSDIDIFGYNLSWKKDVCEGLNLEVGGNYFDMYGLNSQKADFLESYGILTLTKIPLTPHFGAYYDWPYNDSHKGEGWMTDIGVLKPLPFPGCPALGISATALLLSADLWYNGGAWSGMVEPGWAYAEFKAMLPIPLPHHLMLIPGVTYQWSLEDTVNKDDELYATVALQYKW